MLVHGGELPRVSSGHEGAGDSHPRQVGHVLLGGLLESDTFVEVPAAADGPPVTHQDVDKYYFSYSSSQQKLLDLDNSST